jgi:hypothetical protein
MRKRVYALAAGVIIPSLWLAIVAWAFLEWRRGDASDEKLLTTVLIVGILGLFAPAVRLTKAAFARGAKAPPQHPPLNLDG